MKLLLLLYAAMMFHMELLLHCDAIERSEDVVEGQERKNTLHDLAQLYKSFKKKETPLYTCSGQNGYLVTPEDLNCSIPIHQEKPTAASITLFYPDLSLQDITAYECYGIQTTKWISTNFFNAKEEATVPKYFSVNSSDCWAMVKTQVGPNGRQMHRKIADVFGTFIDTPIQGAWLRNVSVVDTNYFFVKKTISVQHLDQPILTTSVLLAPCTYTESMCPTALGILVWQETDVKTCRLRESTATECIYTNGKDGGHLTCPRLKIYLQNITTISLCETYFGSSDQGVYFLQNRPGMINDKIATPNDVQVSKPKARTKRAEEDLQLTSDETLQNARLSDVSDMLQNSNNMAIWRLEMEICKSSQLKFWNAKFLALKRNLAFLTTDIFGEAKLAGEPLIVWECTPIFEYKFNKREYCSLEYPVSYIWDNKEYFGFMEPVRYTIIPNATRLPEPCREFYFETKEGTLLLTDDGPKPIKI